MKLILDFDGTLHSSDLLWEQFLRIAKTKPIRLLQAITALLQGGRPALKRSLHSHAPKEIKLPWIDEVIDFAKNHQANGYNSVVVVTASDEEAARHSLTSAGLNWEVHGSKPGINAKGFKKIPIINEISDAKSFCYVGDSPISDLPVWKASKHSGYVGELKKSKNIEKKLGREFSHVFQVKKNLPIALLQAARPHQWLKNLLVFVPMLAAHDLGNLSVWLAALAAFTALSFTASAVYILNDLCDLDLDRSHLEKKHRPLAAGQLSIPAALSAIPAFFIAGLIVAQASPKMIPFLLVYIALTTIYSFFLKNLLAIDIITLALLYTLRILAGAAACEITPSNWLLVFSFFTFFSLAIGKRFSEMVLLGNSISLQRAYTPQHSLPLLALGAAASIVAIFIPALYVRDPQAGIYSKPEILLLLLPILGAWFTRFWLIAAEGKILSDPVLFAAKDKFSWACAAIFVCVGFLASKIGN